MSTSTPPPERIEWSDPGPTASRKGSKWDATAAALKSRPGQWACIGRDVPTTIVTTIRRGELKCFAPEGAFEAVVRNHSSRWQGDVFARYVGDHQEHAS